MCELFGMSFNLPINPKISFKGFKQRGKDNPDGWGIAYYTNQKALIKKEPKNALLSDFFKEEKNLENIISKIIIGHVRKKSRGEPSYNNTHPFKRDLDGKEYLFAHNGTVDCNNFGLSVFKPIGKTDSEYIFCHLLDSIQKQKIINWSENEFEWLRQKFNQINKSGKLNCLMSNGEYLFCYHDIEGYNGLCFVQRKAPFQLIKLEDLDWKIDLKEEKTTSQTGYIIATKRLTDEKWIEFKEGELIIFKNGKMIYSSHGDI